MKKPSSFASPTTLIIGTRCKVPAMLFIKAPKTYCVMKRELDNVAYEGMHIPCNFFSSSYLVNATLKKIPASSYGQRVWFFGHVRSNEAHAQRYSVVAFCMRTFDVPSAALVDASVLADQKTVSDVIIS